jgi:hypothetical protein
MKKIIVLLFAAFAIFACNSNKHQSAGTSLVKPKTRIDSCYAVYHFGNSIDAFTSKVYVLYQDTTLMKYVDHDSTTLKKVDTTLVAYFVPKLDTAFDDQAKRLHPLLDSATKKTMSTIVWYPIDKKFILQEYK